MSNPLVSDLRRAVRGPVSDDPQTIRSFSWDFGQLRQARAAAVVRPQDDRDAAAVLRFAAERRIPTSVRGAGCSMNGQSLSEGGIALDIGGLDRVGDPRDDELQVGAGATWDEVVARAARQGRLPPVLTSNPWATVGGTLSTGGVGISSAFHGTQACNCTGLTVATAAGEVVECSSDRERDLFDAARGGLGQFGAIVAARLRVSAHPPLAATWTRVYDELDELLPAMHRVVDAGSAAFLAAGAERTGGAWRFPLQVAYGVDARLAAVPAELEDPAPWSRSLLPYRTLATAAAAPAPPEPGGEAPLRKAHPWIDTFMPWKTTAAYLRAVLARPLPDLACRIVLRPLRRDRLSSPFVVTPDAELTVGVSVLPVVARERVAEALEVLGDLSEEGLRLGGKRYLAGWTNFDAGGWRAHFDERWGRLADIKRRFDPHSILGPGVIEWE